MAGYTKEFLIAAYLSRFLKCTLITVEQLVELEELADKFYDKVGRDKFRVYASLDAEAIRLYKQTL
jgi:hypothetical protein